MEDEIIFDDFGTKDPTSTEPVEPVITDPVAPVIKEVKTDEPVPEKRKPGRPSKEVKPEDKSEPTPPVAPVEPVVTDDPEPEPEIEEGYIKGLAVRQGIEIPDGMEFEDSEDGLLQYTEYVTDVKADTKLNNWLDDLGPEAADYFDYLQMIKDDPERNEKIKKYFNTVNPEINYSEINLDDEMTQKAVLKSFYKKNDYSDEQIAKKLDKFEVAGILKEEAEEAANLLSKLQAKERSALLEKEKQNERIKKENTQKFFGNIKQIIESGKVNNFTIPVTERKAQFDYDVQGGFMNDLNEILKDPTRRLELAIAVKNKFNLGKFVVQAANTLKANTLSAKLKSTASTGKNATSAPGVTNNQIDWDNV